MEFGKKSDAKKAMKLHHREGITLKQAWKRVKSKDKKSKKRKTSSPKKRKAVSNAKKAMKLKWKEGITLKQAWKRVNKFGDTVCPSGYEVNTRWEGKRGQQQCIKECEVFKIRNPATGRCVNAITYGQRQGTIAVPDGMEINPETGRLRKMCLPGQYRDPVTKRCKTIKPVLQPLIAPAVSGGLMDYGKKYRFGNRHKCSFGSCTSCSR